MKSKIMLVALFLSTSAFAAEFPKEIVGKYYANDRFACQLDAGDLTVNSNSIDVGEQDTCFLRKMKISGNKIDVECAAQGTPKIIKKKFNFQLKENKKLKVNGTQYSKCE